MYERESSSREIEKTNLGGSGKGWVSLAIWRRRPMLIAGFRFRMEAHNSFTRNMVFVTEGNCWIHFNTGPIIYTNPKPYLCNYRSRNLFSFSNPNRAFSCYILTFRRKMKVIAAYLLAVLGGNAAPSADDLRVILGSVGADANDDNISSFLSEVKGKDIAELIAAGREKLASVPSGGGAAVAVTAAPGGGASAPAAAESKKEEKVEEKEESDDDMGFSLFD
ncbi:unnamed protein product [Sphenostylis stenocarpa]|uniref:60S acidic ribosomal protein P2 n=1 Tax=Sphenostylis stenocarpa TaxID=92480 RepID=A0AA86RQ84_9FABA|nr:unnamed protein product [Sphenostylis stenocarpa]